MELESCLPTLSSQMIGHVLYHEEAFLATNTFMGKTIKVPKLFF